MTVILRSPPQAGDEESLKSFDINRGILSGKAGIFDRFAQNDTFKTLFQQPIKGANRAP